MLDPHLTDGRLKATQSASPEAAVDQQPHIQYKVRYIVWLAGSKVTQKSLDEVIIDARLFLYSHLAKHTTINGERSTSARLCCHVVLKRKQDID